MLKKHKFLSTFLFLFLFCCRLGMIQAEVLPVYDTLGGDFELDSTLGKTVSLKDFEGKLLLIYFGYTSCPDVCPTTLTVIKQAVQNLDPKNELIQVLLKLEQSSQRRLAGIASMRPCSSLSGHLRRWLEMHRPLVSMPWQWGWLASKPASHSRTSSRTMSVRSLSR